MNNYIVYDYIVYDYIVYDYIVYDYNDLTSCSKLFLAIWYSVPISGS
jgi:hypothetical protein